VGRAALAAAARGDTLRRIPPVLALWPPPGEDSTFVTDNQRGLVLRVDGSLLMTADVDSLVERRLEEVAAVEVLKVAHHGSRSSTRTEWLERMPLGWAVISCGPENRFGHPDLRVVERLRARGARVWRTDLSHAAWLEHDGTRWKPLDWTRPMRRSGGGAGGPGKPLARHLPAQ
jgi:beta-lactamase superfamily II metal-dependent hydrolase